MARTNVAQNWTRVAVAALCLAGSWRVGFAQAPPPVILEVDIENYVQYWDDATDRGKLASVPNQTTTAPRAFMQNVWIADVVAVNGKPALGTYVNRTQSFNYRPSPTAGQNIADINRNGGPSTETVEILQPDGTPVGTIMSMGLVAGNPPPGSPAALKSCNKAVVGGTGAFLGVRGQASTAGGSSTRQASQSEDPSLRRVHGGGKMRLVFYLIPMFRPEITLTPNGPAVVHSGDFTTVTSTKPARPGEVLSVFARGLGPTRPGVDPGSPFLANPLASVNAPVEVTVNGTAAEVLSAVGFPGSVDGYQVNFRVPANAGKGTASLQLSAAWITSSPVSFALQ